MGDCCGQPSTIWLNEDGVQAGTPGHFTDSGQYLGWLWSESLALGDLDGGSDLDAYVANQIWFNDGGDQGASPGTFVYNGQSLSNPAKDHLALGDLDGDDDLDASAGNGYPDPQPNIIWFNTEYTISFVPLVS